ncbi:mucin-5AC isoform X2 [Folsomia candida]|uniref:mucin-5AC isoform X2 n=1 Tax=Folsomia candida TaxID=158441 RepID=UPI000B9050DB|nr:mucin-5AC isoform X2 [Folsomia candida]
MISSFWSLCRACPSLPVEKLHTEYRSTFQWHTSSDVGSKGNCTGISHAVVKQPAQSSKTLPFWSGGQGGEERRGGKRVNITNVNNAGVNEWWLKPSSATTTETHRSQNHAQQTRGHSKFETQLPSEESGPKKSVSMGTFRATNNFDSATIPQTHHLTHNIALQNNNADTAAVGGIEPNIHNMDTFKGPDFSLEWTENKGGYREMSHSYEAPTTLQADAVGIKTKEYKSEYKKQFRPFSQYEYVDGKFFKKKGDQDTPNPWYKEVIELRKKAGDYRFRGWGTEFVPQHSSDAYHQHVWDQVSKQPSLAALALITTTTKKSISKEDKEKENVRNKSMPKRSLSRPNTATPKHPISDFKMKDSEAVQGAKKKYDGPPSTASSRASRGKARSQSAGPGGRSPRKMATHHSVLSKEREILDLNKPATRHPRPTTLATSPRPKASSDKGHRSMDVNSKLVKTLQFNGSADPSFGFSEPIIKSPPEPTRVKSPEQVILRSPDPVNWTVPLDTTKSFTVTQNIRDAPPSPRFRAGDARLQGVDSSRSGPGSGFPSSAGSKTSSPSMSSFSPRSAPPAQKPKSAQSGTKPSQPPPMQRPVSSGTKLPDKPPHQTQSVLAGGDRKPPVKSTPYNLNGSGTNKTVLDNRKPDDNANNNKPPTTTTTTTSSIRPAPAKPQPQVDNARKPIPGSTLQCLEDPQFMFDPTPKLTPQPAAAAVQKPYVSRVTSPPTSTPPVAAPRGSIRVLEAPMTSPPPVPPTGFVPPAPVSSSATAKRPGVGSSQISDSLPQTSSTNPKQATGSKLPSYKVLDAPEPAEMYKSIGPSTTTATPMTTSTTSVTPAAGTTASPASSGGKSKHKFDFKFWGKSKDNEK